MTILNETLIHLSFVSPLRSVTHLGNEHVSVTMLKMHPAATPPWQAYLIFCYRHLGDKMNTMPLGRPRLRGLTPMTVFTKSFEWWQSKQSLGISHGKLDQPRWQ